MSEHTEWFPPEIDPLHVGVYQKLNTSTDGTFFAHWNGNFWGGAGPTPDVAHMYRWQPTVRANWPWRGIAKDRS